MVAEIEVRVEIALDSAPLEDLVGAAITDLAGDTIVSDGPAWTDVTADVILPIDIDVGIRGNQVTDRVARPGSMKFSLENSSKNSAGLEGYYSPGHTNAASGFGERAQVRFGWRAAGDTTWIWRFTGRITSIRPIAGTLGTRQVDIIAKDYMYNLQAFIKANALPLLTNVTSDTAYAYVLDTITAQPEGTNFMQGVDVLPAVFHRTSGRPSAFSELLKIAQSGFEYIWVDGEGVLTSQNKTARIADTTLQFTLDGDMTDVVINYTDDTIPDKFVFEVFPVSVNLVEETVATLDAPQRIAPGETIEFEIKYSDVGGSNMAALDVVTTPDTEDISFSSDPESSGSDLNNDIVVAIEAYATIAYVTATNTGTSLGWLTKLDLQGRGVRTYSSITKEAQVANTFDTDKITNVSLHYHQEASYAEAAAQMAANVYGVAWPETVEVFAGESTTMRTNVLTKGLIGKRIKLIESVTALSVEVFINGISIRYTHPQDVMVTYNVAPTRTTGGFIVGTSRVGSGRILFSGG